MSAVARILQHLGIDLVEHCVSRLRGRREADPAHRFESRIAGLGDRGTSGRKGERVEEPTASARSLPDLACGITAGTASNISWMLPEKRSV